MDAIQKVYLIGIGGIGMSNLARWFKYKGCTVAGYDKTKTALTEELEDEGIAVTYKDETTAVVESFCNGQSADTLIIYTPAVPKDSKIVQFFQSKGYILHKRAEVLGIISRSSFCIAVAGTHGKTTTSTIIAHILTDSGYGCSAFLGGISSNYNTNLLIGNNHVMVVEADEYDRSFLQLTPDISVITSMDADHLDIYGDADHLSESFKQFAKLGAVKNGTLICKQGLPLNGGVEYGLSDSAPVRGVNIRIQDGKYYFDFINRTHTLPNLCLGLAGLHNVENAVAAVETALLLGIEPEKIRKALESFKGVKRRFETICTTTNLKYIDDYAHHPEEIRACIESIRQLYPNKKLTAIFQPHLFTRTRDFADGFAEQLSKADELLLLDIYPARELPIEGITSHIIADKLSIQSFQVVPKEQVLNILEKMKPNGILLTIGAGDIDTLVQSIKKIILHKY